MTDWHALRSGQKHQALKTNKDFVLQLVAHFGITETCRLLNVKRVETIDRICQQATDNGQRSLTKAEKAELIARIAAAGYDELARRVEELELSEFQRSRTKVVLEPFAGYLLRLAPADDGQLRAENVNITQLRGGT